MRVPAFSSRHSFGQSFWLMSGHRNSVTTVASASSLEKVLRQEGDALGHAGTLRVGAAFADTPRVDVDADRPRAVFLCGGDHDPSIAASQVVHDIVRSDPGELQHLGDHVMRRRLERDIRTAARRRLRFAAARRRSERERAQGLIPHRKPSLPRAVC